VAASDLDNDGWPDIYVANDSAPATLYLNQKDGTFRDIAIEAGAALSAEAKPQAGMGVSIGDYDRDGKLDLVKTNFAGDTDSLYTNLGDGNFEDRTYPGGLGVNTRLLGWGVGFFDMDNDGWLDLLMSNGHVYPEVDQSNADLKYAEHKYLYRNLRNGRFEEVTDKGGPGILERAPAGLCIRGLRQRWRHRYCGELYQCTTAAAAVRLGAESKLDQDQAGGYEVKSIGNRQPRYRDCDDFTGGAEAFSSD
jgi:enediyne biosynthesis protein E4